MWKKFVDKSFMNKQNALISFHIDCKIVNKLIAIDNHEIDKNIICDYLLDFFRLTLTPRLFPLF